MAAQRRFQTATKGGAMDRGNDQFGAVFHCQQNLVERLALGRLAEFTDIGAGNEGAAAAQQNHGLHIRVRLAFVKSRAQTIADRGT